MLRFDRVMDFFAARFPPPPPISDENFKVLQFSQFWISVSFCIRPAIINKFSWHLTFQYAAANRVNLMDCNEGWPRGKKRY